MEAIPTLIMGYVPALQARTGLVEPSGKNASGSLVEKMKLTVIILPISEKLRT